MLPIVKVENIFSILHSKVKSPKTELNYNNNFTLAIAVILSAQATDISVNKATTNLFKYYNSPEKILELGEEGLKQHIKSIGLFNSKAKNIISLSKLLIDRHQSTIPDNFDALISLPGIGRKTANVILNCAFDKPTIAVDTHVHRVSNRLGLSNAATPEKIERDLLAIIPKKYLKHAHHWLILHGRYTCKARNPLCHDCALKEYCDYYTKKYVV